ncbi:MAG: Ig-like domain-containing protein [Imperialibacter sp.]|uniref:Ig-like domain-containing protein n=1 Tax=Imperialibacter sp. TaxID=2038411 RepID=UPI003A866530
MNAHLIFKSGSGINSVIAIFFSAITLFGFEVQAQNHEWVGVFSGASSVQGNAVVTDASGNVYTTGVFQGTADFDPGAGEMLLTSAGNTDIFITMLNASGELQWARKVGGTSADEGLAIRLDASGNVLISGRFLGTVDFDPGALTANLTASSTDIFVLKLNTSGNYVWAKRWGSNLASGHIGLAVDASDNVYTGGSFVNTIDLDPGAAVVNVTSGASNTTHTFLVKLDASGNYVTGKRLGTPSFASVNSSVLETDASFNVFIAGYYDTSNASFVDFDPDAGVANLSTTSGFFVAKYNSSLAYVSVAEAPPVSMTDLHLDASGNILATGTFAGTKDFDPGIGETNLVSSGSQDAYAFKLNSSYQLQWAKNFGGTVDDQGFTITTDGTGNVYVGGHFFGTSMMDFDPGIGTVTLPFGPNGYDGFILKLNASGEYQWAQSIYGASVNGWDKVNGVFVDGSNKVYSTGFFTAGTVDFNPGPGADNKTATNSDAFVLKWNQSALSAQTITFNPLAAKVFGDAPFALTATASSGLTVSYASSNTAVATVSGATVTIVGAGSTTITASQAGNANYNAATSVPQTLTVNKASQTITFAALPAKTFGDAPFALGATASSGLTVSYASSNTAVATVSGNTVTIVGVGSTTITASQAGNTNYHAATSVPQTLTVTSPDVSAPTVSSFSPANNSTDVAVDANLVATFSEPVALVNTKIIQIVRYPELTLHEQYTLPSANVQVSGSTLTINPTNNLLNSAAYYVYIGSDAITDAAGNPFAGIVSNGIWQFNTVSAGDVTPPAISSLSPADNATGVAVSSTLVVTFSENVVANSGIISIRQVADNSLHSSYNVNGGVTITDNTLTLVPSFDLDANTEYYIDLGAGIVKDAAGNLFAGLNGNPNWTFTTQQSVVSSINYTPNNGSSGISVAANLSITFSENINISTGSISFHYVSNGATITSLSNYDPGTMSITGSSITFDLPNDLPANTEVYVNVTSGYLRSAANSQKIWPGIQDNTSWRFTTGKINQTITFGALPLKTFGNAPFALSATSSFFGTVR